MSTSIHETYAATKGYHLEFFSVVYDQTISFPGMLTNFQNSFKPEWSKESVFGRQDPILTFKNTSRDISVSFTVAAASESIAKRNIRSLNTLIKFLYPAFRSGDTSNSISASPLLKIKFANLIYDAHVGNSAGTAKSSGLICGITDFDHKFDFDGKTSWVDYVDNVFPMSFEISFTAAVQHSHPLGRIDGGRFAGADEIPMPFPYGLGGASRAARRATATAEEAAAAEASINARLKRIAQIDADLGNVADPSAFETHGRGRSSISGAAGASVTGLTALPPHTGPVTGED